MRFKDNFKKKYKNIELDVGFFDTTYPDGTPVAQVALWNEYGTERMPSRPFMRNTIAKLKGVNKIVSKVLSKGKGLDIAFAVLGEKVVGDMKEEIAQGDFEALAPSTVKSKGFDKVLVDTGIMFQSVDWRTG